MLTRRQLALHNVNAELPRVGLGKKKPFGIQLIRAPGPGSNTSFPLSNYMLCVKLYSSLDKRQGAPRLPGSTGINIEELTSRFMPDSVPFGLKRCVASI